MKRADTPETFGKRGLPPTIIVARGETIRYFTIRPWMTFLGTVAFVVLGLGYLVATGYLVMRDDLIGVTTARQARLQQNYEQRISSLRTKVDHLTSRQMLQQQMVQRKVGELFERQEQLTKRHSRLGDIFGIDGGASDGEGTPTPSPRPDLHSALGGSDDGLGPVKPNAYAPPSPAVASTVPWTIRRTSAAPAENNNTLTLAEIEYSLRYIESEQLERVETLTTQTYRVAETISEALEATGLGDEATAGMPNTGGPLIAAQSNAGFDEKVRELDEALQHVQSLRGVAKRLPIASPMPGAAMTSKFGRRRDPILGRWAHHSGLDFRGRRGTQVRATGAGTVVKAGWNGGYGRLVEIDHGQGITTRYAHMSKILVKRGDRIDAGTIIGLVGSSGRSTGPHLHYEVRHANRAVDPLTFISAGERIRMYL